MNEVHIVLYNIGRPVITRVDSAWSNLDAARAAKDRIKGFAWTVSVPVDEAGLLTATPVSDANRKDQQ